MEFLHCNGCGHHPQTSSSSDQRKYSLTSCGHVFCQNCVNRIQEECIVCQAKCRVVAVCAESKAEIKAYFTDPMELFKVNMTQIVQVMQFQKAQFKSFTNLMGKLMENQANLKTECDTVKAENVQLLTRLEALENRDREQNWENPLKPETTFMKQTIDPGFTSIFEQSRSQNFQIGNSINNTAHTNKQIPDRLSSSEVIKAGLGLGREGRIIIPPTNIRQNSTPTFSPKVSVTSGPRSGSFSSSLSQSFQRPTCSTSSPSPRVSIERPLSATRITLPLARMERRDNLMSRYSPSTSISSGASSVGSGGTVRYNPNIGVQVQRKETTPDIVSRLKKLRW